MTSRGRPQNWVAGLCCLIGGLAALTFTASAGWTLRALVYGGQTDPGRVAAAVLALAVSVSVLVAGGRMLRDPATREPGVVVLAVVGCFVGFSALMTIYIGLAV